MMYMHIHNANDRPRRRSAFPAVHAAVRGGAGEDAERRDCHARGRLGYNLQQRRVERLHGG